MLKWLCLGASTLTFPLIPFGAFVRLKNAGLSCPDWPLCYGQIIPPLGFEIALETGHRFVATLLGLLIISITVITFQKPAYYHLRKISVISLILVCLQGILGALTVTMLLWPPVVTLHLIGGNVLFGILVFLARVTFLESKEYSPDSSVFGTKTKKYKKLKKLHIFLMLGVLFVIIFSGGYNSSTYSGAHCEAFPGCHEESFFSFGMSGTDISTWSGVEGDILRSAPLEFQGRFFPKYVNEWIHMLHRLFAIVGGIALMFMSWFWLKNRHGYNMIGSSIVILIVVEIFVGILNAVLRVPVPISTLHTATAATLTGLFFFVIADNYHKKGAL